jgi:hypothetical protein
MTFVFFDFDEEAWGAGGGLFTHTYLGLGAVCDPFVGRKHILDDSSWRQTCHRMGGHVFNAVAVVVGYNKGRSPVMTIRPERMGGAAGGQRPRPWPEAVVA